MVPPALEGEDVELDTVEIEQVFPDAFYQQLKRAEFEDLVLIDALEVLSPSGNLPLDVGLDLLIFVDQC